MTHGLCIDIGLAFAYYWYSCNLVQDRVSRFVQDVFIILQCKCCEPTFLEHLRINLWKKSATRKPPRHTELELSGPRPCVEPPWNFLNLDMNARFSGSGGHFKSMFIFPSVSNLFELNSIFLSWLVENRLVSCVNYLVWWNTVRKSIYFKIKECVYKTSTQ